MRILIDTGTYGEYLHYGMPLTLVTAADANGRVNVSTNISISPLPGPEPRLVMGVLRDNFTDRLIAESHEFVVNVITPELRAVARQCGSLSGAEVDKLTLCGLTTLPARFVKAPLIRECPLNLECQVIAVQPFDELNLWMARIVAVEVDESLSNGRGGVNLQTYHPLFYAFGHTFARGPMVGFGGL